MTKRLIKIQQTEENLVPVDIMAQAIVDIADGMKKVNESRLTREAIVTLIHERSKISRTEIRIVLNNMDQLEQTWLKPKKKQ